MLFVLSFSLDKLHHQTRQFEYAGYADTQIDRSMMLDMTAVVAGGGGGGGWGRNKKKFGQLPIHP